MNKAINKIVDLPKLVKTIWIILWITLLMFLGLKLCFNIWYPIVVRSQTFIKVCDFIDNNLWLEFIIGLMCYLLNINIPNIDLLYLGNLYLILQLIYFVLYILNYITFLQ